MDFIDVINNRRAVKFFDPDKEITDKTLKEIIETAAKVPSGFNLQPWSLIILRGYEEEMRLPSLGCGIFQGRHGISSA